MRGGRGGRGGGPFMPPVSIGSSNSVPNACILKFFFMLHLNHYSGFLN